MFIDIFVDKTVGFLMINTAKPIENQMFHVEHQPFGVYVHVPFLYLKMWILRLLQGDGIGSCRGVLGNIGKRD